MDGSWWLLFEVAAVFAENSALHQRPQRKLVRLYKIDV